jgi:hypothetical protein
MRTPNIIHNAAGEVHKYDDDYTIILADWCVDGGLGETEQRLMCRAGTMTSTTSCSPRSSSTTGTRLA